VTSSLTLPDVADTAELVAFRDDARAWLAEHVSVDLRVTGLWDPTGAAGHEFERRRSWQRTLYDGGWAGVHWPRDYGGRGASLREYAIWQIECAAAGAPDPVGVIGLNMVGPTLIGFGDEAQRAHLGAILSADEIWCQLFSEPDAGSDLGNVSTMARRQPDGSWVVSGQKVWTSWAELADYGLLLARTAPGRFAGLSCFVVNMRAPGITTRPLIQMSGESHFSEVFFDAVDLPPASLVGPLDQGWTVATSTLVHERTTAILPRLSSITSAANRLLGLAAETPATRAQRDRAVALWIETQLLRINALRGVMESGEPGGRLAPVAYTQRLQWGLLHREVLDLGATIAGVAAIAGPSDHKDEPWATLACASRGWSIGGGTSEIQRNMIAEKVLMLPKG
jgi:alkylation response protein AidB-like acyl-CoA dehydrogenase